MIGTIAYRLSFLPPQYYEQLQKLGREKIKADSVLEELSKMPTDLWRSIMFVLASSKSNVVNKSYFYIFFIFLKKFYRSPEGFFWDIKQLYRLLRKALNKIEQYIS